MSHEETYPVFKDFDDLMGLRPCYTRTHEMFNTSQLYLLDSTYTPTPSSDGKLVPDEGCWSGHLGGIDGLR